MVINTDASPMYTSFNTCTVCLCSRIHSQTAVSKCSGTANTAFTRFVDNWCHPWHIYLSGSQLCVQHVPKLLNRAEWIRAALSHDLSVFNKNIFQRSLKRCWCFYNLCLGLFKGENLGGFLNIYIPALPAPHILSLVSAFSPNLILLPLFFLYELLFSHTSLLISAKSSVSFFLGGGGIRSSHIFFQF